MHLLKIKLLLTLFVCSCAAQGQVANYLWAKGAGGDGMDNGNSVAVDASGNSIIAGYYTSTNMVMGTSTLTNAYALGTADFFVAKYDVSGNVLWAKSAGGTSNEYGFGIATDASGNIVVTGSFASPTITFGSFTLTNAAPGRNDVFIVKYDPQGAVLWAKRAGGTEWDEGISVCTDATGNVIVAGDFSSSQISFGTTTLSTNTATTYDLFLVKYDAAGNLLWAKREGGSNNDQTAAVAADGNGNVYVTGFFNSNAMTIATTTLTNAGTADYFIVKYDPSGNALWASSAGGNAFDRGTSVCTDASGNALVTGSFFGPTISIGTNTLINAATLNLFIVKYDPAGNVLWAKSEGGSANVEVSDITTDANGNSLVTGQFTSPSISFGGSTFANAGVSDFFLLKYNPLGTLLWAKTEGGSTDDMGNSVVTDAFGNIFVTGFFASPTVTFGTSNLTKVAGLDVFLLKLSEANTTWITEVKSSLQLEVFPNPISTQFNLRTNMALSNATVLLWSYSGELLAQFDGLYGQSFSFDRKLLQAGLYTVHVKQDNRRLASKKILIKD